MCLCVVVFKLLLTEMMGNEMAQLKIIRLNEKEIVESFNVWAHLVLGLDESEQCVEFDFRKVTNQNYVYYIFFQGSLLVQKFNHCQNGLRRSHISISKASSLLFWKGFICSLHFHSWVSCVFTVYRVGLRKFNSFNKSQEKRRLPEQSCQPLDNFKWNLELLYSF